MLANVKAGDTRPSLDHRMPAGRDADVAAGLRVAKWGAALPGIARTKLN
jgi:hypothetical protein